MKINMNINLTKSDQTVFLNGWFVGYITFDIISIVAIISIMFCRVIIMVTAKVAFPQICRFLMSAALIFLGYAISGRAVFGAYHENFETMFSSCCVLFSIMLGDLIFDTMYSKLSLESSIVRTSLYRIGLWQIFFPDKKIIKTTTFIEILNFNKQLNKLLEFTFNCHSAYWNIKLVNSILIVRKNHIIDYDLLYNIRVMYESSQYSSGNGYKSSMLHTLLARCSISVTENCYNNWCDRYEMHKKKYIQLFDIITLIPYCNRINYTPINSHLDTSKNNGIYCLSFIKKNSLQGSILNKRLIQKHKNQDHSFELMKINLSKKCKCRDLNYIIANPTVLKKHARVKYEIKPQLCPIPVDKEIYNSFPGDILIDNVYKYYKRPIITDDEKNSLNKKIADLIFKLEIQKIS
ncbi:hypothetical protein A3Q56_07447 [Intoshia linei]|uniref:Polycystin cation channel PKD1/PKD2 domain-containing protein n=1 Tax=Intoshia linei TaxID=1819745 RepID=A0A177AS66_9BILA|nr:hypothetical protein A3Q56_07447 [Intoshia linei]